MHGVLPTNLFTSAVSQAVSGIAGRALTAAKSFESDLQSGDIAGAQAFLSTLQQKLGSQGATATGSTLASQIRQVSNDLTAGNLTAAESDFTSLKLGLSHLGRQGSGAGSGQPQSTGAAGNAQNAALSALQSYSPLQQSAYNSALNLSLPAGLPTLSVSS